jgi:syntaxin 1B/2/3
METFSSLRARITSDYRDTVARRYFTVTGSQPDEATLDNLAETGEGERFLQRAIAEQQGRGEVLGVVAEIREQYGAMAQLERSLLELQQVFKDMAVLVDEQGGQLKDTELTVRRTRSFVDQGREDLAVARKHQKSFRKWMCISMGVLLVIILIIVASIAIAIVLNNKKNNS